MPPDMPPVTEAHRRAAFERLALRGWTYEAALQDPLRARVIDICARDLRTREWCATHARTTTHVRRVDPATGRWCTQRVPGPYETQLKLKEGE